MAVQIEVERGALVHGAEIQVGAAQRTSSSLVVQRATTSPLGATSRLPAMLSTPSSTPPLATLATQQPFW
jgi:hypothetical protein